MSAVGVHGGEQLRVDSEAVGDHEDAGTGCPAWVRRSRASRSAGRSSAGVPISKLPIFELSGQWAGASLSKFASASVQAVWPSAASGLIDSPSGSTRSPSGYVEGEAALLSRKGRFQLHVEAGRRVCFSGRQGGVEDRVEGLFFAAGSRRVVGLGVREVRRVLVGLHVERAVRGCSVQVLGLSVSGSTAMPAGCGEAPFWDAQPALACCGHPAGEPTVPFGKRLLSLSEAAGKPQIVMSAEASGIVWVIPDTVMRRP